MTHDPLCPYMPERRTKCTHGMDSDGYFSIESVTTDVCQSVHYWPGIPCQCDLIARVDARAREEATARVSDIPLGGEPFDGGYRDGFRDALDQVEQAMALPLSSGREEQVG